MPEYVRVREGKWEYTIPASRVTDRVKVLSDKDAVTASGKPVPPKPVTDLGTPAPGSKQARKRAAKKTSEAPSPGEDAGQTSANSEQEK